MCSQSTNCTLEATAVSGRLSTAVHADAEQCQQEPPLTEALLHPKHRVLCLLEFSQQTCTIRVIRTPVSQRKCSSEGVTCSEPHSEVALPSNSASKAEAAAGELCGRLRGDPGTPTNGTFLTAAGMSSAQRRVKQVIHVCHGDLIKPSRAVVAIIIFLFMQGRTWRPRG